MNIQQFQYVLAVVDLKNFEAAAERCFVTQSTLSTMIGKLEDEIGIKLFNRKTKPVSITEEGQQIIDRLRIVMNEIGALNNTIQELKGEMVGELRIGVIPTIAPYLLPLFLPVFAGRFPKVRIVVKEMTTAQIQQALRIRNLDVGILALPLHDKELEEIDLYSEPFLVYSCSEEQYANKVTIESLNYSKLCLLQEGHCLRTQVQEICELSDLHAKSEMNFEFLSGSMDSLFRITKTRKGITIIPYLAARDLPVDEQERLVEFKQPVPARKVGLVTHKFFLKKKLLEALQQDVQNAVYDLLPAVKTQDVMRVQ